MTLNSAATQSESQEGRALIMIQDIECVCDASGPLNFPRHEFEVPELTHGATFFPLGFTTELRTNFPDILLQARELWSRFDRLFETEPIRVDVHVSGLDTTECPPRPAAYIMYPLEAHVADASNFSITNLDRCSTQVVLSRGTVKQRSYLRYFLLGPSPLGHIVTRYATPIHAGCIAREGRGVLLCGDSGVGKSTLSYACARAGWTYVSDDVSFLVNSGPARAVTGDCHQIRFRPSATTLFPELEGLEITPRATGKPSIELPTASLPQIARAQTTPVDFLVFLNRRAGGRSELVPYRREAARHSMRRVLFGSPASLAAQYLSLEQLLRADVFELRYEDLDWAVDRLHTLVRKGR
jgi:hypothetical protein